MPDDVPALGSDTDRRVEVDKNTKSKIAIAEWLKEYKESRYKILIFNGDALGDACSSSAVVVGSSMAASATSSVVTSTRDQSSRSVIEKVPRDENIADIGTKHLKANELQRFSNMLELKLDAANPAREDGHRHAEGQLDGRGELNGCISHGACCKSQFDFLSYSYHYPAASATAASATAASAMLKVLSTALLLKPSEATPLTETTSYMPGYLKLWLTISLMMFIL